MDKPFVRIKEIEYSGKTCFVSFDLQYQDGTVFSITETLDDIVFLGRGHDDMAFKAHQRLADRLRAGAEAVSENLENWNR